VAVASGVVLAEPLDRPRHKKPWLVTDPTSGQYRGATIAETQPAIADADSYDDP
jgi:hypothetical protein